MKKITIILLSLIIVAGGAYFIYQNVLQPKKVDIWSFVPSDAVLVYETDQLPAVWKDVKEQSPGKVLSNLPYYQKLENYIQTLDTLAGKGVVSRLLNKKHLLFSLHVTAKNEFDYLLYIPFAGVNDYDVLKSVQQNIEKQKGLQYNDRQYQGIKIYEIRDETKNQKFSFILENGHLVGSFTPFLVEDVIRVSNEDASQNFKTTNVEVFTSADTDQDLGNLYINTNRIFQLVKIFINDGSLPVLSNFSEWGYGTRLDVELGDNAFLLSGFSLAKQKGFTNFLSTFQDQKSKQVSFADLIPLKTAYFKFFGFDNGPKWHQNLFAYWQTRPASLESWKEIKEISLVVSEMPKWFAGEIGVSILQSADVTKPDQILYIKTKDVKEAYSQLNKFTEAVNKVSGDTLFKENFGNHTITHLVYPEFPKALLGNAFAGFDETYYMSYNNYIIITNGMQAMKNLILDIEADNTWKRSLKFNRFLERNNQESNVVLYVNLENSWPFILSKAEPGWKKFLENYGPYLRQFNLMALQFSRLEESFYTNVFINTELKSIDQLDQKLLLTLKETSLKAPVITKPVLLKNVKSKGEDIIVQDSLYNLYALNSEGGIRAIEKLTSPIVNDIVQIDPNKNGDLHYFVVTDSSLYILNKDLKAVNPFPVSLPANSKFSYGKPIDYDGSKRYRLLTADESGNIYMFDMQGNNLEGWQPRRLDGELSMAPGHFRVHGKDFIYAVQQNGKINLMNRRGEHYNGFPLDLKDSLLGPMFIRLASDFKSSKLTTITKSGKLVEFNLLGQILKQEQLYKPEINTSFVLSIDKFNSDYVIVRQDRNRLSVLDANGNVFFEKDYLAEVDFTVQYYNFGTDRVFFAITDPVQEFTFLYDKAGNLMNFKPLNSAYPIGLQFIDLSNRYIIYKAFENKISKLSFDK